MPSLIKKDYFCDTCNRKFTNHSGRNGHQAWCQLKQARKEGGVVLEKVKEQSPEVKEKVERKDDGLVPVMVSPSVSINGRTYSGMCRVSPAKANSIRAMMQASRKQQGKVGKFINHGVKNLGEL